jgi:hypothetical protein
VAELLTSTEQTFTAGAGGWTGGSVVSGRYVATPDVVAQVLVSKSATAGNVYTGAVDIFTGFWETATVQVRFFNGGGSQLGLFSTDITGNSRFTVTGTAPTGTATVSLIITAGVSEDVAEITIDNASLDGSAPSGITGTAAATIARPTAVATGTASATAPATVTIARPAATATGTSPGNATASTSIAAPTAAATGTATATGTAAVTIAAPTAAANGDTTNAGTASATIAAPTAAAVGTGEAASDPGGYVTLVTTASTVTLAAAAPGCALATAGPQVALSVTVTEVTLTEAFAASVQLTSSREE